jgi:hypothetical protein
MVGALAAGAMPVLSLVGGVGSAAAQLIPTKEEREQKRALRGLTKQISGGRGLDAAEEAKLLSDATEQVESQREQGFAELSRGSSAGGESGLQAKGRLGVMSQAAKQRMQAFSERSRANLQALAQKRAQRDALLGQVAASKRARREAALGTLQRISAKDAKNFGTGLRNRVEGMTQDTISGIKGATENLMSTRGY